MRYEFPTPEEVSLAFKALECIQVIVENNCLDNKIPGASRIRRVIEEARDEKKSL